MFNPETPVSEAREIYRINSILRQYRVNFYYSLRKDAIFLFEGRSIKSRIIAAYLMAAFGSILFLFTLLFPDQFTQTFMVYVTYTIATVSFMGGIYIIGDFYRKIKFNKTKTMITRAGISFRDNTQFEYLPSEKIKNMEVVFTARKKDLMKPNYKEKDLKNEGKIIIYNHLGQSRTLLAVSNSDKQSLKDDLEETSRFVQQFCFSIKHNRGNNPVNAYQTASAV